MIENMILLQPKLNKYMKTRLLLLSIVCTFAYKVHAAPPVVTNVQASQQQNSKLVDITYNIALDAGQSAFVELWFSPDNGLNFPVRCTDVNGSVDSNVSAGSKTATWNAESDWDQQFTSNGKIRVIATYGDQPSGFSGSGDGGPGGSGSAHADASLKNVFMDILWEWGSDGFGSAWQDRTEYFQFEKINSQIRVDPTEITNEKWDEVAQWAVANNYTSLPLAPVAEAGDLPRTGITFFEAIKWCNARSEKDGLEPAYYTDGTEATGDVNENGVVDTGPDTWTAYDGAQDPNQNGVYDNGEPYTDSDVNDGPFNPKEYNDYNNNGQYDPGLSNPFRQGANISFDSFRSHVDHNATGYRLPSRFVFLKLATGGSNKTNWPWGDNGPDQYAQFTTEFRVPATNNWGDNIGSALSEPTPATRPANGYDLQDLIGNVAEFSEDAWHNGFGAIQAQIFGGSYLGLKKVHPDPQGSGFEDNQMQVERYSNLWNSGPLDAGSPAVGFRCFINR